MARRRRLPSIDPQLLQAWRLDPGLMMMDQDLQPDPWQLDLLRSTLRPRPAQLLPPVWQDHDRRHARLA